MPSDNPRLKDIFFSPRFLRELAGDLHAQEPAFDVQAFQSCTGGEAFDRLSLKEKMRRVTECLHEALPAELDYARALSIFLAIAPNYCSFDGMVFSDYVARYGLDDWPQSLIALREFTRTISAEFAIRPFLREDPGRALPTLIEWAGDPDPAVRRLASEGSRPRLPWGMALPAFKKDPRPLLPILEQLKEDESEDVRRSVANNLNDIAKDNPRLVLDLCESWYGRSEALDRVVKHACRTLLKAGNVRAMRLFGFNEPLDVTVEAFTCDPARLAIGEQTICSYKLNVAAADPLLLRLEYAVNFVRASGKTSRKIFHHREGHFDPGRHTIRKKHSFRDLSTRTHYPGRHTIELIVNGVTLAKSVVLLEPGS